MGESQGAGAAPGLGKAYRAAVNGNLQRTGEHSMRTAVLVELGVILGVGAAAAVTSLVHSWWWSPATEIAAHEVFGDTISPMIGGAAVTLIVLVWRWRRRVAKARIATWASDQETIAQLRKTTKNDGADATGDASRCVQRALGRLFDAYQELEIVSNRTNDDTWDALSRRLEEYNPSLTVPVGFALVRPS